MSHSLALKWWLRVCGLGKKIGGGGVGKGTKRARDSASASAIHGPEHSSRDSHTTRDEQAGIKTNYLVERRRDRPEAPPPSRGVQKAPILGKGCTAAPGHIPLSVHLYHTLQPGPRAIRTVPALTLRPPLVFKPTERVVSLQCDRAPTTKATPPATLSCSTSNTAKPASFPNPTFHDSRFPKRPPLGPDSFFLRLQLQGKWLFLEGFQ